MMNDYRLIILFLVSAQCISSSLKNIITEHYPDSQVISQQKLSIRICCTLSFNIIDACFDNQLTVLQFCKLRYNILLLTNCEVHTANIRTAILKYGPNEMRSVQKTKVRIFSVWNEQLVNKSFIV